MPRILGRLALGKDLEKRYPRGRNMAEATPTRTVRSQWQSLAINDKTELPKYAGRAALTKIAISVCCLTFSAFAYADVTDIVASNNEFGIQRISTNVNYTETGNGILGTQTGVLDTETGPVNGLAFSISTMKGPGDAYLHAEFNSSNGNTTYRAHFRGDIGFGCRNLDGITGGLQRPLWERSHPRRPIHADPVCRAWSP